MGEIKSKASIKILGVKMKPLSVYGRATGGFCALPVAPTTCTKRGPMRTPSFFKAVALGLTLSFAVACGGKEPDRWADAGAKAQEDQKKKEDGKTPPAAPATKTGTFNKFFPKDGTDGWKMTATADKEGYAEYKAEKDGKSATLSIDDADAGEKAKYKDAKEKIDGHPSKELMGKISILVADKYQVSVTGKDLDMAVKKGLISKFDLAGLSKL